MKPHERYGYSDLESIFNETDIVIVPSIWYETFGYTVLEALSYGVPVIISGNVGSKDIVPQGGGVIIENINKKNLMEAIGSLTPERLSAMNQNILKYAKIQTLEEMTEQIMGQCY